MNVVLYKHGKDGNASGSEQGSTMFRIREIQTQEIHLLDDFLYEAIFIPEGVAPPPKSIIKNEDLQAHKCNTEDV